MFVARFTIKDKSSIFFFNSIELALKFVTLPYRYVECV